MQITIEKQTDGFLIICSDFNQAIVDQIKAIPKAVFMVNTRSWFVPQSALPALKKFAQKNKITMPKPARVPEPLKLLNTAKEIKECRDMDQLRFNLLVNAAALHLVMPALSVLAFRDEATQAAEVIGRALEIVIKEGI